MNSKFTANDYFYPDYRFVTDLDTIARGRVQFEKGLKVGKDAAEINIAVNDVWSAKMKDGSFLQSYEKIGYHSNTVDLLRGFICSACPLYVYRLTDDYETVKTCIG
jgi:hypothetical protein